MARKELSREAKIHAREYDNIRYSVIGTKLPRDKADSFRALCKAQGVSVSAALSVFVRAAIQAGTLDIIRDNIPGQKNIDLAFPQGDQANENDTHGTVDSRPGFDTPGTVDLPTANDTPGTVDLPTANDTPGTVDLPTANDTPGTVD